MPKKRSYLTSPTALDERLYLDFDGSDWCEGKTEDKTVTLRSPAAFADFVADPGAHLHPADDWDRALMLDGLRRYRDSRAKALGSPLPKHDASLIHKEIKRLDAQIARLSKQKS